VREIIRSTQFKRDVLRCEKRGKDNAKLRASILLPRRGNHASSEL
jgi:hypothetical protein